MATLVAANGSLMSSPMSSQEKCSRNKRKFPTDAPILDTSDSSPMENAYHDFEPFPTDPLSGHDLETHASTCNTCKALTHSIKEVLEYEEVRETDWSGMTETELEELLLSTLDTAYKNAIRKITSYGYKDSIAINALLKVGRCYGCKDPIANIAEHALEYLASGKEVDISERENTSEQVRKLEKSLLEEMVSVLREMRPFFSRGDAMWSLLMCDMNLSHACTIDSDSFSSLGCNEISCAPAAQSISETSSKFSITAIPEISSPADKINPPLLYPQSYFKAEMSTLGGVSGFASSNSSSDPLKENLAPSSKSLEENLFSHTLTKSSLLQEKPAGSKKPFAGSSRSRYRSNHSERSSRVHGYRSASRLSKNNNLANLLMDKRNKSVSGSISIDPKCSSLEPGKAAELATSSLNITQSFSFTAGSSSTSSSGMVKVGKSPSLPAANTDASLSLSSNSSGNGGLGICSSFETAKSSCISSFLCHQASSNWAPMDGRDEILVKLVPRIQDLKTQLQDWTDWAQQKVMQAARRLSKDKVELEILRQERDEAARLLKEKETLEVSMMKKVSETEYAWSKACSQYEMSNATVGRLENENNKLRQGLEVEKLRASELATDCQVASMREIMTLKKMHSWERGKVMLNEELAAEKQKLSQLRLQFEEAKEYHTQIEDRWKQEEKLKQEAVMQVAAERNEREKTETSANLEEAAFILETENGLQRYKDDIRRLESQIAKLRLNSCTKIPALSWDISAHFDTTALDSQGSGNGEIQRDRECVMCLAEERSVVFLPCAHQVVCAKCNELHEKQGMKDCPSCRTPIQRRIYVRCAYS